MKAILLLSTCPSCARPLAAVTVGDSHAAQWYAIHDQVIDLAGDALTWCPSCSTPLPVAPVVQRASNVTEVQS